MNHDPNTLLVASHDAGGAAVLAAWIKHNMPVAPQHYFLAGPALKVFPQYLSCEQIYTRLEDIPWSRVHVLLCSTSGADVYHERACMAQAREQGMYVIAALDHWVNYRQRVDLPDGLPDELWVFDEYALARVDAAFPQANVRLHPNAYLQESVARIEYWTQALPKAQRADDATHVLYLSEPSYDARYTAEAVLRQTLTYLEETCRESECCHMRIRVHPRESLDSYTRFIQDYRGPLSVSLSQSSELAEDLAWADRVLGCQTMAMVVALAAGKRVASVLPACVPEIALPHDGIVRIFPPKLG